VVWGVRESKYAPVNYSAQPQWNKFTRNKGPFLAVSTSSCDSLLDANGGSVFGAN